jgi:hypothetical protein
MLVNVNEKAANETVFFSHRHAGPEIHWPFGQLFLI